VLGGEKVAIRMLEKDKLVRGLTELGLSKKSLTVFRDILSKPRGIVLVTGPKGAGKTRSGPRPASCSGLPSGRCCGRTLTSS
jgi:type II secretory ATPase GspE/PulE/Tfp pilus assembly ATPase PilB-like protein